MRTCPPLATLEEFLAGTLPPELTRSLRDHVGSCAACRSYLDRLSDEPALTEWHACARPADHDRPVERGLANLLERLRASTLIPLAADETPPDEAPDPRTLLEPPDQPGDLGRLGPYRVQAELGRGGMGFVLRAWDDTLRRTVAVKVLRPELAHAQARARFVREAQLAAQCKHDHIVSVHAVANPDDGPPYLVMEYLAGPTLAELIRTRRPEPRRVAEWLAQAADGLAAAHARGLIHRDVKPANIMLDVASGPWPVATAPRAKLTDFGLARLDAQPNGITQLGMIVGTPAYMSPEQAAGGAGLDARTDVWGLGVTLYESLTGELPFRGATHLVLQQVRREEPPPPRRLNDAIPRDLETICLKALAKEPARRYQSARELADDLRRWLRGEPVLARPVGRAERVWRWARRNPNEAGLLTALAGLFLLSFGVVTWLWLRADASAADARAKEGEANEQRELAEQDYYRAAHIVNRFYNLIYQDGLAGRPINHDTRLALVKEAIAFYEEVVRRRPAEKHSAELAAAYSRLGWLAIQARDRPLAHSAYTTALTHLATARADAPVDFSLREQQAKAHFYLGTNAGRQGDAGAAVRHYEAAIALLVPLLGERPADADLRNHLAGSYGNLGNVHLWLEEIAPALTAYTAARNVIEQHNDEYLKRGPVRQDLFWIIVGLGDVQTSLEDQKGYWLEAARLAETYAKDFPDDYHGVRITVVGHKRFAQALLWLG